jgi:hypothetical protein
MHMGTTRVHIVLSAEERAAYRAQATREGLSLSEWLRGAARRRLADEQGEALRTPEDLETFFAACDDREAGREPDWDEHLAVMQQSRAAGNPAPAPPA